MDTSFNPKEEFLRAFRSYLKINNYREVTPYGNPSLVDRYPKVIEQILNYEWIGIIDFVKDLDYYISKYENPGAKNYIDEQYRGSINTALRAFQKFAKNSIKV